MFSCLTALVLGVIAGVLYYWSKRLKQTVDPETGKREFHSGKFGLELGVLLLLGVMAVCSCNGLLTGM